MDFEKKEIEGEQVYFFKKVGSTMDIAESFIRKGKEGIIVAEEQSRGRGRYGRIWISPPGGLYLSWILKREKMNPDTINKIFSLTLIETFSSFGIRNCKIKFPNDIMIEGRKIAGILVENKGDYFVVGVGVNLNTDTEKIGNFAISYREIKRECIDIVKFLRSFIIRFKKMRNEYFESSGRILKVWGEYLIK